MSDAASGMTTFQIHTSPAGTDPPYTKADIFQVCQVGEAFALSGYQVNYQDLAVRIAEQKPSEAILVFRMVTDREGFKRLVDEITTLNGKMT